MTQTKDQVSGIVLEIAKRHFKVRTLDTRNSDDADFRTVSVWAMREALEEAFNQGIGYGQATKNNA